MTLQQMEYIVAVEKYRHFGKAAEQCQVTQPTLSAMIQKLEEELEVKIFDRSRQPVVPTATGMLVISQAKNVLKQVGMMKDIVNEEKETLAGTFHIGVLPTIAPYLLPRVFPILLQKYPMLDIRVSEMKTKDIKVALDEGTIDAGIVADLSGMEQYHKTPLFYEPYQVYISRGSELYSREVIKTSDLADVELWLLDEGHCFRDQFLKFCQLKSARSSQEKYRLGSLETFMRMVESGRGATFIPALAVHQMCEKQIELVRPFAVPCPTRKIIMLTHENFIRHKVINMLVREIQEAVPNEMLTTKATQILV